jgi:hypothetical protein
MKADIQEKESQVPQLPMIRTAGCRPKADIELE